MSEDRRTKAQLLAELERVEAQVVELEDQIPAAPRQVPEAGALASCIRALDDLATREKSNSGSYSAPYRMDFDRPQPADAVGRVIRGLMLKYGAQPEIIHLDCKRRHVEELTAGDIVSLVQGHSRDLESGRGFLG